MATRQQFWSALESVTESSLMSELEEVIRAKLTIERFSNPELRAILDSMGHAQTLVFAAQYLHRKEEATRLCARGKLTDAGYARDMSDCKALMQAALDYKD